MPFKNYRTLIEIILFWVMPFTVLSFLYFAFSDIIPQAQYVLFLLFPALTMYLVVGVGAGYCRFWYFNTFLNVKGIALTLGFVYSAVVNLGAWIFFCLFESIPVLWLLGVGVCCAAGGTLVDILLLGSGLFYTKSKKFPVGSGPLKHALSYGPSFFGMVGCWNALGLITGSYLLSFWSLSVYTLTPILSFLFALPFTVFFPRKRFILKKRKLVKNNVVIL